jgi:uncharacterized protein (TIGR03382 family)
MKRLLLWLFLGGAARADVKVTTPYPGVTHTVYSDATKPLYAQLVAVDVTSQEIHLYATQSPERGQTVSGFAQCAKGVAGCVTSDVAINGDLFAPVGFVPDGLAIGDAKAWPDASDNNVEGWFAFGRPMDVNQVGLAAPMDPMTPPATTEGAVGGRALLVHGGQAQTSFDVSDPTEPFRSAPRTAVGIDANGHILYLAVVDGDQASSAGMTAAELAQWLLDNGASEALELDGGGSSSLYIKKEGGLVSSPSDGVERQVANHLGIRYGALPYRASVVGFVFDSSFNGTKITNADVTVDGVTATWQNGHTLYSVDNVTPHYVCARASAPGYKTGTQCRQITTSDIMMSQIQYLSLVLYPGSDPPPDMAVPPDLAVAHDLSPPEDLGTRYDVAAAPPTLQSGGCTIAPSADPGALFAVVVFIGGAALFRRRRA